MCLGLFFTVLELRENGFKNFVGTKNISEIKRLRRGAQSGFVYELLGSRILPSQVEYFRTEYQS